MRGKITKYALEAKLREARADGQSSFVYDTELRGFGARVSPTGVSFFVEYRLGGRAGRNRRMAIGRFGELTVDEARRKAKRLRADISDGVDVMQRRDEARLRMTADSFATVVERYLEFSSKPGRYWKEVARLLTSHDLQAIRNKPLETITRVELVAIIDRVAMRSPSMARALFAALRPLFKWCIPRGIIETSPLDGVTPPAPLSARDRILNEAEIAAFWQATEALGYPFSPIYRLLLLTGQRRSEVAGMRWDELDLAARCWVIPAERTKNGKPHLVDLSPQALEIIDTLDRNVRGLLFSTTSRSPPSGFSKVKQRLDHAMSLILGEQLVPWRNHDLRRTAASGMAALDVPPHVVERVLNHLSGAQGGLTGVYQRHEYREERRRALVAWGAEIQRVAIGTKTVSNIVPLFNSIG